MYKDEENNSAFTPIPVPINSLLLDESYSSLENLSSYFVPLSIVPLPLPTHLAYMPPMVPENLPVTEVDLKEIPLATKQGDPNNTLDIKKQIALHSAVLSAIPNSVTEINREQEKKIQDFISHTSHHDVGAVLCGLHQQGIIPRSILIKLLTTKNSLQKDSHLCGWWEQEKNLLTQRYPSRKTTPGKVLNLKSLDAILNNSVSEQNLVADFKASLTKYARENFYTYKSGNNYFYSILPNDESFGGRCNAKGDPLVDELGNELTDAAGNFKYAIIQVTEGPRERYTETKVIVSEKTPGATALTDQNGKPLANKYREIIAKEKPKNISRERAQAVNYLFALMQSTGADEIYSYIMTPKFQSMMGADEKNILIWQVLLKHVCKNFTDKYQQLSVSLPDENLIATLLDEKTYTSLSAQQLAKLFWQSNLLLVADIIVNLYQDQKFEAGDINFQFLKKLLVGDEHTVATVNARLCEQKKKLLLPFDSRIPGKNNLEEERLTKQQLFQYDGETVASAEHFIRQSSPDIIINSNRLHPVDLDKTNSIRCQVDLSTLNWDAPYFFFQVPAGPYMLLDPELDQQLVIFSRYKDLKNDLRSLVHDKNASNFGRPVIFFGILNLENIHYIPYFIYKNKAGMVFVTVVDSSPQMYPKEIQGPGYTDGKMETYKKIAKIFNDIFPGCAYYDPMVTQMLRQRDCGPHSAQVTLDAVTSAKTSRPLLHIDPKEDSLKIDPTVLSVQGRPHGVNPYTRTCVYPACVEENSNKIRSLWEQRLSAIDTTYGYYRSSSHLSLSVVDPFELVPSRYSYAEQVERQVMHDERNSNISAINSILLSHEGGNKLIADLISNYKRTLEFVPIIHQMTDFIKNKTNADDLERYLNAHENNLGLLLEDLCTIIIKDHLAEALEIALTVQVLRHLPDRYDLNAETVVATFLEKHQTIFKKLFPREQLAINDRLKKKAEHAVRNKLTELHSIRAKDLIKRNCYHYLINLNSNFYINTLDDLSNIVLEQLNQEKFVTFFSDKANRLSSTEIEQTLSYLKEFSYSSLRDILFREINNVAYTVLDRTTEAALKKLIDVEKIQVNDLLKFFDAKKKQFIVPAPEQYLAEDSKNGALTLKQVTTVLGMWIQPRIHKEILAGVSKIFASKVREKVEFFVRETKFVESYTTQSLVTIDNLLSDNNTLSSAHDFSLFIGKTDQKIISIADYKHASAHSYIQAELQKVLALGLVGARKLQFEQLAQQILTQNKDRLAFGKIAEHFKAEEGDLTGQIFVTSCKNNKELESYFVNNFLQVYGADGNLYNRTGGRFYRYFTTQYTEVIARNYSQATQLKQYIGNLLPILGLLFGFKIQEINALLTKYETAFNSIRQNLDEISLYLNFAQNSTELKKLFNSTLSSLLNDLVKAGYMPGDVRPAKFTSVLRPTLCSVMGFDTEAVLTPSMAKAIDENILAKLKKVGDFVSKPVNLIRLREMRNPPSTYNKPMTVEMLSDLISFWYCNRTILTNTAYLLETDKLPPLIQELVRLVNTHFMTREAFTDLDLVPLKKYLQLDRAAMLRTHEDNSLISQVTAALLRTKELAGELKQTKLSFEQLLGLLRGANVKSLSVKPASGKKNVTVDEFQKIVAAELETRTLKAAQEAESRNEEPKPLFMNDVKVELLEVYNVQGLPGKKIISSQEFEGLVVPELRRRNQLVREEAARLPEDSPERRNLKFLNMNDIRNDLKKNYEVEEEIKQEEDESTNELNYVSQEQLQRKGLNRLQFFGETELEKELMTLRKRHEGDDTIDEYDLKQLCIQLTERWNKLCLKEKENAGKNHYLNPKPDYRDSAYIALAGVLAQYYRKQDRLIFMYELLMPNYFLPSEKLKAVELPQAIIKELTEVGEGNQLYDIDKKQKLEISATTIDDIPLSNLIITRSGYPLNINWILQAYGTKNTLQNPYTGLEFSQDELDDILFHPQASSLVDKVVSNCIPHVTPQAIDLLENYIIGTVYERGFSTDYNETEQKKSELAAQIFRDERKRLPKEEEEALMNEIIPGANNDTVAKILRDSKTVCIAYQGLQLAKVVIAYKGSNHSLPKYVINHLGGVIPPRNYNELNSNKPRKQKSNAEEYITRLYLEKNSAVLKR